MEYCCLGMFYVVDITSLERSYLNETYCPYQQILCSYYSFPCTFLSYTTSYYSDDALQQYLLHQKQFNPQLFGPNASDEILTSNKMFVANPSENLPIILQNGIDTWLDVCLLQLCSISIQMSLEFYTNLTLNPWFDFFFIVFHLIPSRLTHMMLLMTLTNLNLNYIPYISSCFLFFFLLIVLT